MPDIRNRLFKKSLCQYSTIFIMHGAVLMVIFTVVYFNIKKMSAK